VAGVIVKSLGDAGHAVTVAGDCAAARAMLDGARYDLAIVDVGLPDGSGLDLCRAWRADGYDLPVLILTAQTDVRHRVAGLDAGADDYLGKPFAVSELLARVRALGRRGARWTESRRSFGPFIIDRDRRLVTRDGELVPLTAREFDIAALLAWRGERVVPRDEILEIVWGDISERAAASLEVLVTRIRRKFGSQKGDDVIRTVRQVGYAWAIKVSKPA